MANYLGCAQTTVAGWEGQANRTPDKKTLAKIADFFKVTIDYLLGAENFEKNSIPCYGDILSKGFTWPKEKEAYPLKVSSDEYTKKSFALKVLDDDLLPFIQKNDYGIFKKAPPKDGDIVVVRLPEQENLSLVRRWKHNQDIIALLATNPISQDKGLLSKILKHENEFIKILPEGKLVIEGVFIGIKRPFRI